MRWRRMARHRRHVDSPSDLMSYIRYEYEVVWRLNNGEGRIRDTRSRHQRKSPDCCTDTSAAEPESRPRQASTIITGRLE
ncbi:hypothetical protein CHELA40_50621 [Chelatococcus asaccharovorans]|nr:hypothetical protein CHELA40_50621 [Chelatococcus asaccharovorans]